MAKSPNTTRQFDLLLSKASQKRLDAFQQSLEASAQSIASMKQDLKNLGDFGKAAKIAEMARRPGALDTARRVQGVQARSDTSLAAAKEAKLYADAARKASALNDLEMARGRQLRNNAREIAKIASIEEAQAKIRAAELRYGMAVIDQDKRKQATALQLKAALEARLNTLKNEQAELARIAKEEERRAAAAAKSRMQPLVDLQNAQRGRKLSEQRVLGDGGASLFRIQTGLLANYAVLNTLQSGFAAAVQGVVEFDNSLRNLQAIVDVTDGNMVGLRESILQTAESTRFSATEVSEAAVLLGQAGLSGTEIDKALDAVAKLATATGTDLAKSVDTATAILGAFNLEAGRMAEVANTLTQAVNMSKLDMEKLTLGIQYAGNTAYDAGVSLDELTAGLGAMANAGIRSGSTLGTGMRQILVSLEKPSETFRANLEKLGLTTYDVDLKTKGLAGVMKTLREAGFSASDAIESFEVRSAAAFIALSNNIDMMENLQDSFVGSTAATRANETQMRSLKAQYDNFTGALQAVVAEGMQPITYALRDGLIELNKWFQGLRQNGEQLRAWGTIIAQVIAGIAAFKTLSLVTNLVFSFGSAIGSLITTVGALTFSLRAYAAGAATAAEATAFLTASGAVLAPAIALVVGAIAALTAVYMTGSAASSAYEKEQARLTDQMDRVKSAIEKTQGILDSYKQKMSEVDDKLQQLADRQSELRKDTKLLQSEIDRTRRQFAGMGYNVSSVDSTVQNLIGKLQQLRAQLAQDYTLAINVQIGNLAALRGLQNANITSEINNIGSILQEQKGVFADTLSPEQQQVIKELQDAARSGDQARLSAATLKVQQQQDAALKTATSYTAPSWQQDTITGRGANEEARKAAAEAQAQADYLSKALQSSANINNSQSILADLGLQESTLQESGKSETQKSTTYSGTFERINNLPQQINEELSALEKATKNQPVNRMERFMVYEAQMNASLNSAIEAVKADPILTESNKKDLISKLEASRGRVAEARQKFEPEYYTLTEGGLDDDIGQTLRYYGDQMDKIGSGDTDQQSTAAANKALEFAQKELDLRLQRAAVRVKDGQKDASVLLEEKRAQDEFERKKADIQNALDEKRQRLSKQDAAGGGKADAGAGRDFNLMMDDFKTGIKDAEQDLKYGDASAVDATARMDAVIAKAKEELEIRRQLMAEQKEGSAEYNRLKSEEKTLLGFIREEEAGIRDIKEKQGLVQVDLVKSLRQWAQENLNLSEGLESGFLGVMDTMKSGLSTLFSDLMSGTKSAKEAFRDFAMSVVESIQNVIAEMMAMYLMKKILGIFDMTISGGEIVPIGSVTTGAVRKARGGLVEGNLARDSKLHSLMPGEYVLRKSAVDMIGVDTLNQINAMGNRAMAAGGHVGAAKQEKGALGMTNVYVVPPDQKPVPGPGDIIAVISDDIARGGPTKKLIKSVAMGY